MLTLYKPKVIFSIDNVNDLHIKAKFLRMYDTLLNMGKVSNSMSEGTGCWEGTLEQCFMVNEDVFDKHIRKTRYLENQEAVLHVAGSTKQPAFIEMLKTGEQRNAGVMRQITRKEAYELNAWTNFNNRYYEIKATKAQPFSEYGYYGENNAQVKDRSLSELR